MIEEIASDFYRIEIPLPETQLEFVNSYIIRDRERSLIIDTGLHDDECFNVMQAALKKLDVDLKRTDFFITHCHGDHIGLVSRLTRARSIVYINELEAQVFSDIGTGVLSSEIGAFLKMSGFPEKDPEKILPPHIVHEYKSGSMLPFRFVEDGDTIERGGYRLTCVKTPGHSKGHMCLYESAKKIFVAGDHILGDITPGIQGRVDNENPLKDYLSSLDKVYALKVDLVLPGHKAPFRDFKNRIEEIKEHHRQRTHEVLAMLQEGSMSVYDTASRMTWNVDSDSWDSFPVLQSFFATEEAYAHLRYLEEEGKVERKVEGRTAIYAIRGTS